MAVRLGPKVLDVLLFGPEGRRRQLIDFPVLGDVWTQFAEKPDEPCHDLLIIPTRERPSGEVAALIAQKGHSGKAAKGCSVAYLQNLVVASFGLRHLYEVLIPATRWWDGIDRGWQEAARRPDWEKWIRIELAEALGKGAGAAKMARPRKADLAGYEMLDTGERQAVKLGALLGLCIRARAASLRKDADPTLLRTLSEAVVRLGAEEIVAEGSAALDAASAQHAEFEREAGWKGVIFQITLNRPAELALTESVAAIKGDAARLLFKISCKDVAWAVLDSGIDYTHPAFRDHLSAQPDKHRIKAAFDFRRVREMLGVAEADIPKLAAEIRAQVKPEVDVEARLREIADDRDARKPLDWNKIAGLLELDLSRKIRNRPPNPHGTHVAGILGADFRPDDPSQAFAGVCPDINIYDFRVLGSHLGDSEFAITAALQFIRFYNEQTGHQRINGVNMSLSIAHNVRNYACGRTPVCLEAEALVANNVVVVAAAGNRGYQNYRLDDETVFESYAASSITDPGNAEGVITVGSTHRHWPHTYGVSFFSSRGPTGDGRLKPDLLAPGEKITSCIPRGGTDEMDGTSMAAPHVSGAAALLMARHKELKGQPARIKEILCETATDLRRERSFQGRGMVDVLRALQSV